MTRNPVLPGALLAQAIVSLCFAATQLGWIAGGQTPRIALAVLVLLLPVQAAAMVEAAVRGQTATASGAGLLGGLWAAEALGILTSPPDSTSSATGLLLVAGGVALAAAALMGVLRTLAAAVIAVAALRFAANGVYQLVGSTGWKDVAGCVGLVLAATSLAVALALGIADEARARRSP